jgi:hypothetical protein
MIWAVLIIRRRKRTYGGRTYPRNGRKGLVDATERDEDGETKTCLPSRLRSKYIRPPASSFVLQFGDTSGWAEHQQAKNGMNGW